MSLEEIQNKGEHQEPRIPDHLYKLLTQHLFPEEFRQGYKVFPKNVSEPMCQSFTRMMHEKLREYLSKHPEDTRILKLLSIRLPEEKISPFVRGEYSKDLISAKTLKRYYEIKHTSHATENILEALALIFEKEEEQKAHFQNIISRVSAAYHEYVTHHNTPGTFQESLLIIDGEGNAVNRYVKRKNPQTTEIVNLPMTVELIGTTGLLLSHIGQDDVLIFYLYIGLEDHPPFLQGVYLYSDLFGNTVANLAVFQRTEEKYESIETFIPARENQQLSERSELKKPLTDAPEITIGENIQRYLYHHAVPIAPLIQKNRPFNFAKKPAIFPASDGTSADFYLLHRKLEGHYKVYFNERFPSIDKADNSAANNRYFSTIGIAVLEIFIDSISGALHCRLEMNENRESPDALLYEGKIINDHLRDPNLVILSLYSQMTHHRYIHLLLSTVDRQKLIGCFNISYQAQGELGAGIAVAIRQTKNDDEENATELTPEAVNGTDKLKNDFERKAVQFLSANHRSRVSTAGYSTLDHFQPIRYVGIYRMFYHTRKHEKHVGENHLILYANGQVSLHTEEDTIHGMVEQSNATMLTITLRDNDNSRTGFFCIRVDNIAPNRKDEAVYCGSFAGFSREGHHVPLASQFILEYVGPAPKKNIDVSAILKEIKEKEIHDRVVTFFTSDSPTVLEFERPVFEFSDVAVTSGK